MSTSSSPETSADDPRQHAADPSAPAGLQTAWGQRRQDRWLERWMETTRDLARRQYSHRMLDAVIEEIDGRQIRIGDPVADRPRILQLPQPRS